MEITGETICTWLSENDSLKRNSKDYLLPNLTANSLISHNQESDIVAVICCNMRKLWTKAIDNEDEGQVLFSFSFKSNYNIYFLS